MTPARRRDRGAGGGMRAGVAGLRASGSRCDLRRRAALLPCRPRSRGARGQRSLGAPLNEGCGQRPPPICESDRDRCTRPRRQRRLGEGREARVERGRRQPARPTRRTRIALGRSTAIARSLMCLYSPRRCSCALSMPRVQGMTEGKPSCPITRDRGGGRGNHAGSVACDGALSPRKQPKAPRTAFAAVLDAVQVGQPVPRSHHSSPSGVGGRS